MIVCVHNAQFFPSIGRLLSRNLRFISIHSCWVTTMIFEIVVRMQIKVMFRLHQFRTTIAPSAHKQTETRPRKLLLLHEQTRRSSHTMNFMMNFHDVIHLKAFNIHTSFVRQRNGSISVFFVFRFQWILCIHSSSSFRHTSHQTPHEHSKGTRKSENIVAYRSQNGCEFSFSGQNYFVFSLFRGLPTDAFH